MSTLVPDSSLGTTPDYAPCRFGDVGLFIFRTFNLMVKAQIERLKRDLRSLEDSYHQMLASDRTDGLKVNKTKRTYIQERLEELLKVA